MRPPPHRRTHARAHLLLYRFEYLWQDQGKYKRPTKMPAPEYIEHLMAWVQGYIDNEQVFPSRIGMFCFSSSYSSFPILRDIVPTSRACLGVLFPKNFQSTVRQLVKRLYRVYAHIYCHHYSVIVALSLDPHMNTSFKHYVLFIKEFNLESGKDFYGPLLDMVDTILKSDC